MSAFDPKRTSPPALHMFTSDIQAAVRPVLPMRPLVASFSFLPAESFGWPLWIGAGQLVARVAGHRRVAAHDRRTLGVARDCLDVGKTVRSPRFDHVDHALRATPSVGQNDL